MSIVYTGQSVITKSDHSHMPPRTSVYEAGDERGHIQASSLGGSNSKDNVAPMHKDVNRGSYRAMERGETAALKSGAQIQSEKIAYSDTPGGRPSAFMVNDTVTYPDGRVHELHHSFSNISNADMELYNKESNEADFTQGIPNDGRPLNVPPEEYQELMEESEDFDISIEDSYSPEFHSSNETPGANVSSAIHSPSEPAAPSAETGPSAKTGPSTGPDGGIGGEEGGEGSDGGMGPE